MNLVGVVGGIGPAATCLLFQYVIQFKDCQQDSDHIPLLIYNNPQIPNNNKAVCKTGPPSVPAMVDTILALQRGGATSIAIPCNTAHAFLEDLKQKVDVPIIDMIHLAATKATGKVGLLSTIGTIQSKIYHNALMRVHGVEPVVLNEDAQQNVQDCITRIKGGQQDARDVMESMLKHLNHFKQLGCTSVILGCTEIPLVLTASRTQDCGMAVINPLAELAMHIIDITKV